MILEITALTAELQNQKLCAGSTDHTGHSFNPRILPRRNQQARLLQWSSFELAGLLSKLLFLAILSSQRTRYDLYQWQVIQQSLSCNMVRLIDSECCHLVTDVWLMESY